MRSTRQRPSGLPLHSCGWDKIVIKPLPAPLPVFKADTQGSRGHHPDYRASC